MRFERAAYAVPKAKNCRKQKLNRFGEESNGQVDASMRDGGARRCISCLDEFKRALVSSFCPVSYSIFSSG